MITYYFDVNLRTLIQSPGNLALAGPQTWVYGDNYNLQVYVVQAGQFLPILSSDTLTAILFQPQPSLPEQQLAIIGTPQHLTDTNGNNYFSLNINLATAQLAAITQAPNKPAICQFHFVFNPTDQERFSESQDVQTTVNPDPTQGATGGTPAPPGYPANPNVFEQVANKNAVGGYVGLDGTGHLNPAQIPTDTTLHVSSGQLSVIGGSGGGGGNPYIATIPASFSIPAESANVAVTLGATVPDIVAGASLSITDGVSFINVLVASISGTALTITNNGAPGAITGTMGVNSHVYMGSTAGPTDTARRGTAQKLPTTNPTTSFYRGDDSFTAVGYGGLTGIPASFSPSPHANTHLTTGGDPISLATVAAAGLCPPPDGSTIIISGGKLVSTVSGGSGNPYVAIIPAAFTIPAAGSTVAVTMSASAADLAVGTNVAITDGSHILNAVVTVNSGTSLTVRNTGATNGSVSGTMSAGSHVYLGNAGDLASTSTPGICRPDGTSIVIASGVLSSAAVAPGQHGCRLRNSANVTYPPTNQLVPWDTVVWGTDTFAPASGGTAITIPAGMTGIYAIGAWILWTATASGTYRRTAIRYNATANAYLVSDCTVGSGASQATEQSASTICKLNAGDTIDVFVATDATSLNILTAYSQTAGAGGSAFWCVRIS